ncbi:MAG: SxtJ family membrane protein [Deltaproteobacteria bacterium]|nr:SxtJ family membrane protein [Deltaproteobacteria bacterium]
MDLDRLATSKTINVLTLAVLIAYVIFSAQWLLWVAVLLTLGNSFESRFTTALARYWMKFAAVLGAFNSRVILTVTFYLILTPLAFVYRIFNRPLVDHFRANKRQSYFEDLNKIYTPADFEKTW